LQRFIIADARWLGAGFLLAFMSSFGQTFFIALFSGEIRASLDLSDGQFGTIYGVATLVSAATLIFVGRLADLRRLGRVGAFIAAGLGAAAAVMAGATAPLILFLAIYGLRLFGQGMMTHVSQTAIARWFAARRGRALAIVGFGQPTGEAFLPVLVVVLITAIGWRRTWGIAAAFLFLVAVPVLWVLLGKDRKPSVRDGEGSAGPRYHPPRDWTLAEVLRDGAFYLLMLGLLSPAFIGTGIFFNQVHIVEMKGWSLTVFASAFPLYAATSVAVSYVFGWMIDRWGVIRLLWLTMIPYSVGTFFLAAGGPQATIFVFMVPAGITAGMYQTLNGALWPELYGTLHLGAVRAVATSVMVFGSAAAPFVLGLLIDAGVSFDLLLYSMGGYFVFAVLLLTVMSVVLSRRNPRIAKPAV